MHVHANIESLSWESEFFRLNSAKLHFNETAERLTEADLNAFERVQAKVPAHRLELVDALSALGFRLVEGEVELALNIAAEPTATQTAPLPGVRMATPKDIPQLRVAAAKVFATSRFRAPWYDSADCARFYAVWIEKAVLGRFDHQCLLALDDQGQPVGFVSLRDIAAQEARIGLLAAYPGGTGKGIGSRLMTAAITQCVRQGVQRLRVTTQVSNIAALRLYQRHDAVIESTAYWFYRGRHDPI